MENIKIDYHVLSKLIRNGLLEHHKDFFIGALLIRESTNTCNQKDWNKKVDNFIQPMTHNIIANLKEHFGNKLTITEENELLDITEEVMKDISPKE